MRAYGTSGGGVMFVPDEIGTVAAKKSCIPAGGESALKKASMPENGQRPGLFGRRKKQAGSLQKAA